MKKKLIKKGMVKPVVLERVNNWCQKKKERKKLKKLETRKITKLEEKKNDNEMRLTSRMKNNKCVFVLETLSESFLLISS